MAARYLTSKRFGRVYLSVLHTGHLPCYSSGVRSNLAGPFVVSLLARAERSLRWAARYAGCSHVALGDRLRGDVHAMGLEKLQEAARACGASCDELALIADLHAIDRGALPLDEQTTPEEVRAARAAILEARK